MKSRMKCMYVVRVHEVSRCKRGCWGFSGDFFNNKAVKIYCCDHSLSSNSLKFFFLKGYLHLRYLALCLLPQCQWSNTVSQNKIYWFCPVVAFSAFIELSSFCIISVFVHCGIIHRWFSTSKQFMWKCCNLVAIICHFEVKTIIVHCGSCSLRSAQFLKRHRLLCLSRGLLAQPTPWIFSGVVDVSCHRSCALLWFFDTLISFWLLMLLENILDMVL